MRLRVCVYQGARLWPDEELLARLGLGGYATCDEVRSRLAASTIRVDLPITTSAYEITVRLPAEPPPSQPEAVIAGLQQQILELQRARQTEAARADRAEARCREIARRGRVAASSPTDDEIRLVLRAAKDRSLVPTTLTTRHDRILRAVCERLLYQLIDHDTFLVVGGADYERVMAMTEIELRAHVVAHLRGAQLTRAS